MSSAIVVCFFALVGVAQVRAHRRRARERRGRRAGRGDGDGGGGEASAGADPTGAADSPLCCALGVAELGVGESTTQGAGAAAKGVFDDAGMEFVDSPPKRPHRDARGAAEGAGPRAGGGAHAIEGGRREGGGVAAAAPAGKAKSSRRARARAWIQRLSEGGEAAAVAGAEADDPRRGPGDERLVGEDRLLARDTRAHARARSRSREEPPSEVSNASPQSQLSLCEESTATASASTADAAASHPRAPSKFDELAAAAAADIGKLREVLVGAGLAAREGASEGRAVVVAPIGDVAREAGADAPCAEADDTRLSTPQQLRRPGHDAYASAPRDAAGELAELAELEARAARLGEEEVRLMRTIRRRALLQRAERARRRARILLHAPPPRAFGSSPGATPGATSPAAAKSARSPVRRSPRSPRRRATSPTRSFPSTREI